MSEVVQYSLKEEVGIQLTEAARQHILSYLQEQKDCKGLLFSVKKRGCSGYSYEFEPVFSIPDKASVWPLDEQFSIYITKIQSHFFKNITVDYVKQGLNKKFVFINPSQTGQCGCGESFTID
jgi:iron-sulfur cluster assembly protein